MKETIQPLFFITNNESLNNSSNNSLQEDILESTQKENELLRSLCTQKDKQILSLTKNSNKKDKTISNMQSSAGRTVGLANKK